MEKRVLKFRAWDNVNRRMGYFAPGFQWLDEYYIWHLSEADGDPNKGIMDVPCGDNINLMQFTGLKDKNGKEIYEGDVLEGLDGTKNVVKFENGCFMWGGTPIVYVENEGFEVFPTEGWANVIGDVYQNPELIPAEAI